MLNDEERNAAILNAASLKLEITVFKKELSALKSRKKELSQLNAAAKVEVGQVEKEIGRHSKPVWKGIETILEKDWSVKRPCWCCGDVLGHECRKLTSVASSVCPNQGLLIGKT